MINVLLVASGRRTTLARKLIEKDCKLWAYESDPYSPIAHYATLIRGLEFDNPELITDLTLNIAFHGIDLVIPCYDNIIPILAEIKESTNKISEKIVCSPKRCAEMCFNKELFEKFMIERFPEYYPSVNSYGDVIAKLKFGCGSKGIKIYTEEEARNSKRSDDYIYQKFVTGKEYTADCYVNRSGKIIGVVPRLREVIFSGEVLQSSIVWDTEIIDICKKVIKELGAIGPLNIQLIREEDTQKLYLTECNVRLGGGTTFSIAAGLNILDYIIDEYVYNNPIYPILESQINKKLILRRALQDFYFEKKE